MKHFFLLLSYILILEEKTFLTRLRIGHSRLTHKHYLLGEDFPECIPCDCRLTIKHVLIECINTADIRKQYFNCNDLKVSHSYRIWNVFAQPKVASEMRRTSHFVTSDVVNYPLRYLTIHNSRLSEQVRSMSDLSLLQFAGSYENESRNSCLTAT